MVMITEPLISRDEDIDRASRSLKAMSHPLRLKILCTLGDQEISVQDIVESVGGLSNLSRKTRSSFSNRRRDRNDNSSLRRSAPPEAFNIARLLTVAVQPGKITRQSKTCN